MRPTGSTGGALAFFGVASLHGALATFGCVLGFFLRLFIFFCIRNVQGSGKS
jgi:hypothetical protein